jgi:hypothetical protein
MKRMKEFKGAIDQCERHPSQRNVQHHVSAENGPVHRGDLLVTSSTPGHAMKAGPNPPQGTVLGKALGELTEGSGVILVLVTLQ